MAETESNYNETLLLSYVQCHLQCDMAHDGYFKKYVEQYFAIQMPICLNNNYYSYIGNNKLFSNTPSAHGFIP